MGTGLLRLEYTTPAPILSPATLVPPRLAFLETSKVASSKGDFSTGLLWPSWGKTEEGSTHSSTEATSWGYQAWSGLVTKGPILFSATGALAGRRHKECLPQSSVSPGVGSGYSEEFRPPAIFFHQLYSVPSHYQRLRHCVSSPVLGAAGPASDSSPCGMSRAGFPGAVSNTVLQQIPKDLLGPCSTICLGFTSGTSACR